MRIENGKIQTKVVAFTRHNCRFSVFCICHCRPHTIDVHRHTFLIEQTLLVLIDEQERSLRLHVSDLFSKTFLEIQRDVYFLPLLVCRSSIDVNVFFFFSFFCSLQLSFHCVSHILGTIAKRICTYNDGIMKS